MNVAIIPARGGSKRIPGKNIKKIFGVPVIQRTIQIMDRATYPSGAPLFDAIYVSSEAEQILQIGIEAGADILPRPEHLADDHTTTLDLMAHHVGMLQKRIPGLTSVCCVYPTAALMHPSDLMDSHRMLINPGYTFQQVSETYGNEPVQNPQPDYVFPIVKAHDHERAMLMDSDGHLIPPPQPNARTQDLRTWYHDAGQFYWGTANAWATKHPIYGPRSRNIIMPRTRAVDVDEPEDWEMLEALFAYHHRGPAPRVL